MSEKDKLRRLAEISSLLFDTKMMALEKAARARQASLDRLEELNRPSPSSGLSPLLAAEVALRYQLWADQRRSEINALLARQTVACDEARQEAALAFGRNQALQKLRPRKG